MSKSGKGLWSVVVVLFLIMAVFGGIGVYIYTMVTDASESPKLYTTASTSIYEPMVRSILLGEEETITDADVNGILRKITDEKLSAYGTPNTKKVASVNGIAVYMQGREKIKIYAKINFKGVDMIFSADARIILDTDKKQFNIDVSNTKLGKLSIPAEWIMEKVEPSIESIGEAVEVESTKVTVPAEYKFEFMEEEVELHIERFGILNGKAVIETNSAMDLVTKFVDQLVDDWLAS
ncbi:MAG: hypothetical protein UE295_05570 [Acutalibacteraceae bacterium]|nr:hypothetical protein [Acutalibacteraceae bacterium]